MVNAWTYSQFDADYTLPYPGEGMGGWNKMKIPVDPAHTAIVVMHAWDVGGTIEEIPGLYRMCEEIPRTYQILRERFPGFLEKVRASGLHLIHVGSHSEKSIEELPGYQRVKTKWGVGPSQERICSDPVLDELNAIHHNNVFYGSNLDDYRKSLKKRDFAIMPLPDEDVVCTSHQLFSLCKARGISHLIYTGFCINACLMLSPCGWVDMTRHGLICSIVRELTTAVENKESCRTQAHKEIGLWTFALDAGFVFEQKDLENDLLTK